MDTRIYRAKRKDNSEWVDGYYAKLKHYLSDDTVHIIIPVDSQLFPHGEISYFEEIIPETLGRLIDHPCYDSYFENEQIFQNDIIAVWSSRHSDVDHTRPDTTALVVDEHSICEHGLGRWFPQDTTRVKVIGNAYDNPELLQPQEMNFFVNGMHDCPEDYTERHSKLMNKGVHGAHACCYICNFPNDYICYQWNGGCSKLAECQKFHWDDLSEKHAGD